MNNKQMLYSKAKQIISMRRQTALDKAQLKKDEIYNAIPSLLEYDNKIINAGIAAARLNCDNATKQSSDKMKEVALLENQRTKLLENAGYTKQDLTPKYYCPVCKDTARDNGKTCECVYSLMRSLRREEINNSSPLKLSSFEDFSLDRYSDTFNDQINATPKRCMSDIFDYCKSYAEHFNKSSKSLFLTGTSGLGKTHLALSIANSVLDKGFDVIYVSAQNIFEKLDKQHNSYDETDLLQSLLETDLLILDDLGTEYLTPYIKSTIYNIINTRINSKLPTIYTSNENSQDLLNVRYTEKVTSRLLGSCEILFFVGNDIRLLCNT